MFFTNDGIFYHRVIAGFILAVQKTFKVEIYAQGEDDQMHSESGIDAAISAFVRHTELGTIKYEGKGNQIAMEMILRGYINDVQKQQFIHNTYQSLALFYKLRKINITKLDVNFLNQSGITILTLIRDDMTISEDEIDLYVALVSNEFTSLLLNDGDETINSYQHDVKKNLLKRLSSQWNPEQKIIAYRHRGKMFVFE